LADEFVWIEGGTGRFPLRCSSDAGTIA